MKVQVFATFENDFLLIQYCQLIFNFRVNLEANISALKVEIYSSAPESLAAKIIFFANSISPL